MLAVQKARPSALLNRSGREHNLIDVENAVLPGRDTVRLEKRPAGSLSRAGPDTTVIVHKQT